MPKYAITIQTTIDADSPDAAADWLRAELRAKLQPGEEGSPWVAYDGGIAAPSFVVASIRQVATESPTPQRRKE